jgi:hypothetical protein
LMAPSPSETQDPPGCGKDREGLETHLPLFWVCVCVCGTTVWEAFPSGCAILGLGSRPHWAILLECKSYVEQPE